MEGASSFPLIWSHNSKMEQHIYIFIYVYIICVSMLLPHLYIPSLICVYRRSGVCI